MVKPAPMQALHPSPHPRSHLPAALAPTLSPHLCPHLSLRPSQDLEGNRVTLMTVHAAKGLEYHSVFFVGFEDGLVPLVR